MLHLAGILDSFISGFLQAWFRLQQIVDLDEKNQILTSNIWLNLDWEDHSMLWNPDLYNGVQDVRYTKQ